MKNVVALLAIAVAAVAMIATPASAVAAGQTHVRVHIHNAPSKLYITPMGEQCAYNASIDPAEYPCRSGGVCVRKNETYGVCELPKAHSTAGSLSNGSVAIADDSIDSVDDNDDESDDNEDDDSDSDDDN